MLVNELTMLAYIDDSNEVLVEIVLANSHEREQGNQAVLPLLGPIIM